LLFLLLCSSPTSSPVFPYTTLFRSCSGLSWQNQPFSLPARFQFISSPIVDPVLEEGCLYASTSVREASSPTARMLSPTFFSSGRSEEHTSELQSPDHLVCRLLLAKK